MKIILYELKKIWNWKIIGLMVIIASLFYQMFLYYPIEHFRDNHPHIEGHDLAVEMTERYGTNITEEELEEFIHDKKYINELEFETIVETSPVFEEVGITTYEDYQLLNNKFFEKPEELTNEEQEAIKIMHNDEQTDYRIYIIDRINAIAEDDSYIYKSNSILDGYTFETTMTYIGQLAILILLLSLLLVSHLVVSDRTKHVHFLQYTSTNGRKILSLQMVAVMISAFLLTTLCIVVFGGIILRNDILVFWDNNVNSFLNSFIGEPWFELTFGEYILISILFIYILTLSVTLVTFIISRFSQNMVTMIMKLIPVFAVTTIIFNVLFNQMFTPHNLFYQLTSIVGVEGLLSVVLLVAALVATFFTLKKEKYIDIY